MDRLIEIVKVYVRAGSGKSERLLSLQPPKEISQSEWLKKGFAFDGNSVVASITPKVYVAYEKGPQKADSPPPPPPGPSDGFIADFDGQILPGEWAVGWSLTKALQNVEGWLVEWLESLGYAVEFA